MREEVFSCQTLIDHAVVRKWRGGFAGVECGRVHKKGSGLFYLALRVVRL
jgi:hypothetical protein